ncbi:Flp pilus assembly protein CpaB [Psychrobacter sp. YGAH215]|uniref:Flp pilus assembly protein CpaB n=1 Tax=Psychrobacter sp. YGAH215 TaxID=2596826 RepID=UPI0011850E55|nr:Flp pilus assembly protein CpaB [Psychrobacter sp. YGAH215]TSB21774.1 Flp pilus assembly protein CpaB [Psychrobacter sp. YGAH215]
MKTINSFKMKRVNKNVLALIISIVLALLCAFLLKFIVDKKIANSLETETISYIVANSDLASGTIVDPFDQSRFAIRSDIPAEFAQSTAITPEQADSINGALLLSDLKRGDILTWQFIDTDERRQLASRLSPGRRALTIPVDDQSSISSMLNPNDHIDLILTYQKLGNVIAAPLMQNVRVLATGDSLSIDGSYAQDTGYNDGYSTITLDLNIDDVSRVTTALELGRLSAVLRNPDDMSYTTNIVSLETLQRELNLKTFSEQDNIQNERLPNSELDDYLAALDNMQESRESIITEPPAQTIPKKPSIDVVYGNRSTNN